MQGETSEVGDRKTATSNLNKMKVKRHKTETGKGTMRELGQLRYVGFELECVFASGFTCNVCKF